MKVGDLVKECVPLMAGDVPERIGLLVKAPNNPWYTVLFDKEELVHYNSLKKMETYNGS
jgi:hypothetical protein